MHVCVILETDGPGHDVLHEAQAIDVVEVVVQAVHERITTNGMIDSCHQAMESRTGCP